MEEKSDGTEAQDKSAPGTLLSRIDAPYKSATIADLEVGEGVLFRTMPQVIEGAKLMARADIMLPPHARNRPEVCMGFIWKARSWKLIDPFFVANHSYVVSQKRWNGQSVEIYDTIAYDSAVFQAALLASGAIKSRPQYVFRGEGEERTCTVGVQTTEGPWEELTTPPLRLCHPGKNEKGATRGSPLWDKNPDQQLGYFGLRNLVRLKFQDVIAGFYDRDEFVDDTRETAQPASPQLMTRLPGKIEGTGFSADVVDKELAARIEVEKEEKKTERKARTARQEEAHHDDK